VKGKIDNSGNLCVLRAGKIKMVGCPRYSESGCGDWCSLFKEPVIKTVKITSGPPEVICPYRDKIFRKEVGGEILTRKASCFDLYDTTITECINCRFSIKEKTAKLQLCETEWIFENFEDERIQEEGKA
jgi:hypothetical protein